MKPITPILIFLLTLVCGCNSQTAPPKEALTDRERYLCDSLKIDTTIVLDVRIQTDSSLTPFPMDVETILNMDYDPDSSRKQIAGLIFNASNSTADNIVLNLYHGFRNKGY